MSTIKDVAKEAGVSITTVSYVVNGSKNVKPDTAQKVQKAIEALNYSPNHTAKSFKTGKKHLVAFILPDISNNYFANISNALESELSKFGYGLILANTRERKDLESQHLKQLTAGIVDGIILASTSQDFTEIKRYIPKDFPLLLIDRKLKNCSLDTVSVSDTKAILDGMDELIKYGHTRIGYIGDIPRLSTAQERLESYKSFLKTHNLPFCSDIVKTTNSLTHEAYFLTEELLKKGCTALVVGNNIMTTDAYCYLMNHKEKYPNIHILGYEHKDFSPFIFSEVGKITLNEETMGIEAARQILNRIHEPAQPQKEIIIYNKFSPTTSL